MSNTTDKSQKAIKSAFIALTAIKRSSELASRTTDQDGNPIGLDGEIEVIHSIANSTAELLHNYLDEVPIE